MTEPAANRLDGVRFAVLLILRSAHDKGIPKEQVVAWLKNSDWQQFFREVRSFEKQRAADEKPLTPDLFRRLRQLIHLEGQPFASAREINLSDIPPTSVELAPYHSQIQAFINETGETRFIFDHDPTHFASGKALVQLPPDQRILAVRAVIERILFIAGKLLSFGPTFIQDQNSDSKILFPLNGILNRLLRATLPLTKQDLANLLTLRPIPAVQSFAAVSLAAVLTAIEQYLKVETLPLSFVETLGTTEHKLRKPSPHNANQKPSKEEVLAADRIARLLGKKSSTPTLTPAEPWAAFLEKEISNLPADLHPEWDTLIRHLQTAKGAKPSRKWLAVSKQLAHAFGIDRFCSLIISTLPLTPGHRSDIAFTPRQYAADPNLLFSDTSQSTLKGLAWAASLFNDPAVSAALGDLGETCWKKIPNHGPRSKLVGNAVLWSLSVIGSPHAVAQLTRINSKLKHASARTLADKAMNRVAESTGQTRDDLEELAVPTFDLDPTGKHTQTVGTFTATLSLTSSLDVDLTFTDTQGKPRKSSPTELKTDHSADLKFLQRRRKEIETVLAAQRFRIESLLRFPDRSWSFENWKLRYAEHPLLSHLTRRLIWQFSNGTDTFTAIPHNHQLLPSNNSSLIPHTSSLTVKLWHPCTSPIESVRDWRKFLTHHAITQPFKQAHREIYLLTDAERQTATYSNRFAAHIIRQHQFAALCAARGWRYKLQGAWDSHNVPTLEIPSLNLRAEFWVEQLETPEAQLSTSHVFMLLSTDQVRFHDRNTGPLPLQQLSPQLFSEIMRDVDLFIGVCSVGNDPTWNDGGPDGRYRQYWHDVSFGDLTASAHTRKEILASLLPRLAIASVASLSDKFLIIQGSLRTYKIHLGSANILMQPNDQYLCIVPDRSTRSNSTANLHFPFEGDTTLALILSKAPLLAHDAKITDPSILRQIRP